MKESGADVFARNLKHYTALSGKTGKQVAMAIGVSPAAYSYWTTGKRMPSIDTIEMLANYFHIRKSDLIDDNSNKKRVDPQTVEARIISVGVDKMTPENREKALNMMRLMFAEIYESIDEGKDDDDTKP